MTLPVLLEKYRSAIDGEIKAILSSYELPLYAMMRYHLGWTDQDGRPAENSGGKALRPALCLFGCEAAGGDYHKALPVAAAVELIHNFSLIHDDIQDGDRERRHRPTVWAVWGQPQAINAGTAMRLVANLALSRLGGNGVSPSRQLYISRRLDEISLRLIEGQYLDISYEDRYDITVQDYLTMISNKTAALISGSLEAGALVVTESDSLIGRLKEAGYFMGLAFQIKDDILGVWGNEKETGKPSGNDILRRKKSFPIVSALERADCVSRDELVWIYGGEHVDERGLARVLAIFEQLNIKSYAQERVRHYSNQAKRSLSGLSLLPSAKQEIDELIDFLTEREY